MFLQTLLAKINNIISRRSLLVLLSAITINSCADEGCIDADDFGEYQSQTIEVPANFNQDLCAFNHGKELIDQGPGIKTCLTSGTKTITDEGGVVRTSSPGCTEFTDSKFKNICINNCIQTCNSNTSSDSSQAEPNWVSTDRKIDGKNIGVTISPGSEIMIRAIGSVVLGDKILYPDMFVEPTNINPHSKDESWDDVFLDVRKGQSLSIEFSGRLIDGADSPEAATTIGLGNLSTSVSNRHQIINASKRLVAYAIPIPSPEYSFNASGLNKKEISQTVPLLPDPEVWECSYSGGDKLESNCSNSSAGYTGNGYNNVDNEVANTTFPVTSGFKSSTLSRYGGMIRWTNDGLIEDSYDPFTAASSSCDGLGTCNNITNVLNSGAGLMLGDLSGSSVEIPNNSQDVIKLSLKSLTGDNNCNITLSSLAIVDSTLNTIDDIPVFNNIAIDHNSWTNLDLTLEPGQKLIVAQNSQDYPGGVNCGRSIAVKKSKYHDIEIIQSGFVKFTMLRGSGNCTIKGRVINPNGSRTDIDSSYTADFYEYDHFSSSLSNDPLENLSVTASPSLGSLNWSNKIFLRKGQKIRFSPESWEGQWTTSNGLTRQCGIGMAMVIEPRPALLCRGKATEKVMNPDCIADFGTDGILTGCIKEPDNCDDNTSPNYCPADCRRTESCTPGNEANNYTKNCTLSASKPALCNSDSIFLSSGCSNCNSSILTSLTTSAKISVPLADQCYDLENYKGKVSNIPDGLNQNIEDVNNLISDSSKAKGLIRLNSFSGNYGNLVDFTNSVKTDANTGNKIFPLKRPLIFTNPGRLKFFFLDGKDFNGPGSLIQSYNNNSNSGASYSGSNGFKISLKGTLEFNNGQWLQARLCAEDDHDSTICKNSNPIHLSAPDQQPKIIELTNPTTLNESLYPTPSNDSNYRFNSYGNLYRTTTTSSSNGDCIEANHGIESKVGDQYYCHTYQYFNDNALSSKTDSELSTISHKISLLRLTFKIFDPEQGSCVRSTGSSAASDQSSFDGILVNNPYYDGNTANNNQTCSGSEIPGHESSDCKKEFYCADKYYNNSGKYFVNVKVKEPASGNARAFIGDLINPIIEIMDGKQDNPATTANEATIGQAERVYRLLISDSRYQAILTIMLVTMFTFYGFGYLIGVVELSHADIINRIIKIGLIYLFVGETGWYFFNEIVVNLFKGSTDYLAFMMASAFDNAPELTSAITNGEFYNKALLFNSADRVFDLIFSVTVGKKVSALLFASIFGWAYMFLIYAGFLLYVYAVSNAVLIYLTAQVFISILFVLGPIFFVFTLFSQTKDMFDNWLKQLIGFSLQQIFLLTTLAFFNMMMYEVIKMSLGYRICWDEVWTLHILTRITLLSWWTISSLPPRTDTHSELGNIGNPEGIPSLFTILFLWVIASLMRKFIGFMSDLAASIAGGISATSLGSEVSQAAVKARKAVGKAASNAFDKTGMNLIRRLDKSLFDSGKLAQEARNKKRKQNSLDLKNKNQMAKAGDSAVNKYKEENAKNLMNKSKADQRDILRSVRSDAMNKTGKKLGLDQSDINRLRSDKGLKYVDTNIFGAGVQALKQKIARGGGLGKTLDDRKVKSSLTTGQAKQNLKSMTKGERDSFLQSAKEGGIGVKGFLDKKASSGGSPLKKSNYDQAAKELTKEGIIDKHKYSRLTAWTRDKNQKKLIKERALENKDAKKTTSTNSVSTISELNREAKLLNKKDDLNEDNKKWTGTRKAWETTKDFFNPNRQDSSKAAKELDQYRSSGIGREKQQIKTQMSEISSARKDAVESLNKYNTQKEAMPEYKEMSALEARKDSLSQGETNKLERLQKIVANSDAGINSRVSATAINQLDNKKANLEARSAKLDQELSKTRVNKFDNDSDS